VKDPQLYFIYLFILMPSIFHWATHHNTKVVNDVKGFSFGKNKPMLPYLDNSFLACMSLTQMSCRENNSLHGKKGEIHMYAYSSRVGGWDPNPKSKA
jgi:hypothetical protein